MKKILKILILLVGSAICIGSVPSSQDIPWTHEFEELSLEEAKHVARNSIILLPEFTRTPVSGWKGFDSPNGSYYSEISMSRGTQYSYDQLLFSNLNADLEKPNHAVFWNTELLLPINDQLKWYCRMGNIGFLRVGNTSIVGETAPHNYIPGWLRQYPMEHAFYCEVVYGVYFRNCLFEDLGGHGIYIAYRPNPYQQYAAANKEFDWKPFYYIKDVALIDTDQDASKGSHSITFFDPGSGEFPGTIIIEDTSVINGWDFERYQGTNERFRISDNPDRVRACGPIVVTNYEEFPEEGWPTDRLTLRRCVFWSVKAKHSMGDLRNIREVLIEDCFFRAQDSVNPILNIGSIKDEPQFKAPERVIIRNCKSDGVTLRIWLDGENYEDLDLNTVGTQIVWTPE
jgi:hypothetical protein